MSDVTSKVAFALVHSGCLKFGSFRIKSGAWSPYYIDLASLLSSPKDFCTLVNITADEIRRLAVSERLD